MKVGVKDKADDYAIMLKSLDRINRNQNSVNQLSARHHNHSSKIMTIHHIKIQMRHMITNQFIMKQIIVNQNRNHNMRGNRVQQIRNLIIRHNPSRFIMYQHHHQVTMMMYLHLVAAFQKVDNV